MRTSAKLSITFSTLLLAAAIGCGTPGAPMPPSLELPTPVDDLSAARKGNTVVLAWTPSQRTTDKQNIRHSGVTRICRAVDETSIVQCTTIIQEIPADQLPKLTAQQPRPKMIFRDTLPGSLLSPTGFATYAVEMVNNRGKSAGLSNQRRVALAPTMPPPVQLSAVVSAEGVTVRWTSPATVPGSPSLEFHYRVLRSPAEKNSYTLVEDVPFREGASVVLDKNFSWDQTYDYKVVPVTEVLENGQRVVEVEGDDSPIVSIAVKDVFPPAQVSGVQAVFSGAGQATFIDLTWAPNTESDVDGYEVFRHEEGTPAVKISSQLVKSPSFRDANVQDGRKYFYTVRAVDVRGNAGPFSPETTETVPAQ